MDSGENVVDSGISSRKGNKKMEAEAEPDPSDDFDIARMSLSVKNFSVAKTYALRILGQYKNLSVLERARADQILAIAQVLLAPPSDLYAVLQLNRETFTPETLALLYRRLVHLLDPQLNPFAYAFKGFKLVAKAYSVLSSPQKKSEYDAFYPLGFPSSGYRFHHEEEEKKMVQETQGRRKRQRQTARKTVRAVDFISVSNNNNNNNISGEEEDEEVPAMQPSACQEAEAEGAEDSEYETGKLQSED